MSENLLDFSQIAIICKEMIEGIEKKQQRRWLKESKYELKQAVERLRRFYEAKRITLDEKMELFKRLEEVYDYQKHQQIVILPALPQCDEQFRMIFIPRLEQTRINLYHMKEEVQYTYKVETDPNGPIVERTVDASDVANPSYVVSKVNAAEKSVTFDRLPMQSHAPNTTFQDTLVPTVVKEILKDRKLVSTGKYFIDPMTSNLLPPDKLFLVGQEGVCATIKNLDTKGLEVITGTIQSPKLDMTNEFWTNPQDPTIFPDLPKVIKLSDLVWRTDTPTDMQQAFIRPRSEQGEPAIAKYSFSQEAWCITKEDGDFYVISPAHVEWTPLDLQGASTPQLSFDKLEVLLREEVPQEAQGIIKEAGVTLVPATLPTGKEGGE